MSSSVVNLLRVSHEARTETLHRYDAKCSVDLASPHIAIDLDVDTILIPLADRRIQETISVISWSDNASILKTLTHLMLDTGLGKVDTFFSLDNNEVRYWRDDLETLKAFTSLKKITLLAHFHQAQPSRTQPARTHSKSKGYTTTLTQPKFKLFKALLPPFCVLLDCLPESEAHAFF